MRNRLFLFTVLLFVFGSASCSKKEAGLQPGTPAFYWASAKTTYHNGDFVKTNENLIQILSSENEYTGRARVWATLMAAGIARGYSDMAAAYDAGAKANRPNPTPFIKQASAFRTAASTATLEFAQNFQVFLEQAKSPTVALAFDFPTGAAAEPAGMKRITSGILVQDSERDALLKAMLQRAVVLTVCEALGSPDDTAKALDQMKNGDAQAPRAAFLYASAKALHSQADLFGPTKMDRPDRVRLLCEMAQKALQEVPANKDSKTLTTKVEATIKKLKKS